MPGQKRVFTLDVPGIHLFLFGCYKDVDGRNNKSGHDGRKKTAPYFSPTLKGGSPLLGGTVSSAIANIIATIT